MQCLLGLVCAKHLFFNEKQKCCTFTRDQFKDTPERDREKKKKKAQQPAGFEPVTSILVGWSSVCYATTTAHGTFGAVGRCLLLINVSSSYYLIYFTLNWTPAPTSLL